MREAALAGHREALLDCDLQFHLHLCEAAGNPFLLDHARRILLPFFAFVRMRVTASQQDASVWSRDLEGLLLAILCGVMAPVGWNLIE